MKVVTRISALAFAVAIASILPAAAHHSTAAFDSARVVKLEGTITQFRWINPHASIKIDATSEGDDPDGVWTVEMTAPNVLINEGWTRTALQVGDKVTMYVNPLRNKVVLNDGSTGGLYVGVVLKDGSKLGRTDGQGAGSDR
jgi:Family of unknown function (DUF6152)